MKRFILIALCFVFVLGIAGCDNKTESADVFSSSKLLPLMGNDKAEVVKELNLNENDVEILKKNAQEEWVIQTETSGQVKLAFYNDVFMAYEFMFDDLKTAYECAVAERKYVGDILGNPTTYPGYSPDSYFDNIRDYVGIISHKMPWDYLEEWSVEKDGAQMKKMLGDKEVSRIDLVFGLKANAENNGIVYVKYSAVR